MHRRGHELLAGTRLALQQHAGLRGRDPRHEFEHALKGRRPTDESTMVRHPARNLQRFHLLDEPAHLARSVTQGRKLDVHILLPTRCLVQMQHPLTLARRKTASQGAGFASPVARHTVLMGNLVAGAPHHRSSPTEGRPIGGIGRDHTIVAITQDVRFREALKERHKFRERARVRWHGRSLTQTIDAWAGCLVWRAESTTDRRRARHVRKSMPTAKFGYLLISIHVYSYFL